jgi:hypothetical protein
MKVLEKMHDPFRGIAAVLVLGLLLLGGCSNLFSEKPGDPPSDGEGSVVVTLSPDVAARTLLPSAAELFYTLTFTRTDPAATFIETLGGGVSKTVGLGTGTWDLVVYGYRNPADAYPLDAPTGPAVAEGHVADIEVSGATPVQVDLSAVQTGTGTLRYRLSYPPSPPVKKITLSLEQRGGGYSQTLNVSPHVNPNLPGSNTDSTSASGQLSLPSGYYDLVFYLYHGKIAVLTDLVHIYDNLETPASFTLTAVDFAEPLDTSELESALQDARTARAETVVSADGTGVGSSWYWINQTNMTLLEDIIAEAEAITANRGAGMLATELETALEDLNDAVSVFNDARDQGEYDPTEDTDLGLFDGSSRIGEAGTTLAEALAWLRDNNDDSISDNDAYTVVLGADESLAPWTLGGSSYYAGPYGAITDKSNVTLTLTGKDMERIVSLNANGSLFTVHSGVTLVLGEHITLRGRPANTASLVVIDNAALVMEPGSKIAGNSCSSSNSFYSGGVRVSGGTFTMNGGEVSGNSSSSFVSGGGVYVNGIFTMNDGAVSGNSSSSSNSGGGVFVGGGIFTMNGGEISGNSSSSSSSSFSSGGGVYVGSGIFTMNGGEVSGNSSSSSSNSGGGGVYIESYGTFTMSGGEILGNSSSAGGGVFVAGGIFTMSGAARVDPGNPVYLSPSAFVTIGGAFTGPLGPVASVEFASGPGFIGKPLVKWADGQSGALPVDRLIFPSGWTVDSNGVLAARSTVPLTASETGSYLSAGATHFYRFTPEPYQSYTVTLNMTRQSNVLSDEERNVAAAWADGSGSLMTYNAFILNPGNPVNPGNPGSTSPIFIASKPNVDIIVMVYNYTGNYTIKLNEVD